MSPTPNKCQSKLYINSLPMGCVKPYKSFQPIYIYLSSGNYKKDTVFRQSTFKFRFHPYGKFIKAFKLKVKDHNISQSPGWQSMLQCHIHKIVNKALECLIVLIKLSQFGRKKLRLPWLIFLGRRKKYPKDNIDNSLLIYPTSKQHVASKYCISLYYYTILLLYYYTMILLY